MSLYIRKIVYIYKAYLVADQTIQHEIFLTRG